MSPRTSPRTSPGAQRRRWFDPRFAIGIALVLVSVAGVVAIIAVSDSSVTVMAVRSTLSPGQLVGASDLVEAQVRVGTTATLYLAPDQVPADGIVVTRSVAAGELLPLSAVAAANGLDETTIVLELAAPLPASVVAGSRLDVWAARTTDGGIFEAPTVLVPAAVVVRLVEDDSMMAGTGGDTVEVLIPRSAIARVLEGVANGAALSAVPLDLPRAE